MTRPVSVSTKTTFRSGCGPPKPATATTASLRPSPVNRAPVGQPPRSAVPLVQRTRPSGLNRLSKEGRPAAPAGADVTTASSPAAGPADAGDAATSCGEPGGPACWSTSTRDRWVAMSQETTWVSVCAYRVRPSALTASRRTTPAAL